MTTSHRHELTFHALLLGVILSVVMGAANVYLGVRVGMTVSASIPAAVIATGILRGIFRRKGVLEANMVQTAASAGESIAAGIVFTIPALLIAEAWENFSDNYVTIALVALGGGMLGIMFMIPMRRVFVVESPELAYPEGKACAEVLRAATAEENVGAARVGLRLIVTGLGIGVIFEVLVSLVGILASKINFARILNGHTFFASCGLSPMLIGVGVIVGLPIAIQVFLGGAIGWLVTLPLLETDAAVLQQAYAGLKLTDAEREGLTVATALDVHKQAMAEEAAGILWSNYVRYMGVGAMVVGGLISLWQVRRGLAAAVGELLGQVGAGRKRTDDSPTSRDIPGGAIVALAVFCVLVIATLYYTVLANDIPITILTTVMMIVMAFFFTAVASYIVGLVGNSNSPVSGMTIMALLSTGLLIYLLDYSGTQAVLATLGVAGVVCCAACTSGDVCNDLKTGYLVGASPRSQQVMQVIAVLVACFIMGPVLQTLHDGSLAKDKGGLGVDGDLPAPQATLMASITTALFPDEPVDSDGGSAEDVADFEWGLLLPTRWQELPPKPRMMAIGATLGIGLFLVGQVIRLSGSNYRLHVMPIAVGIYLPLGTVVALVVGGVLGVLIKRTLNRPGHDATGQSVLAASGLIAGEALAGIAGAFIAVMGLESQLHVSSWIKYPLSVAALLGVCYWIYHVSQERGVTDTA
ncbi:MAG: oligopeptide transporter, OPT family [Planctomycetota bacterium]|nr:MAG: oligopeptide transporter, OPT family [Planctomycetota bacterium]REJ96585.1 MAG: oligopeptide transporter, OPT family [Planctomycetota bacterium]REK21731.1 MAG: oligopeptide transporter, OPT family [Planctomycetota bacterium]REK43137.1 MAG: oligopeptide transporter, OPT family [Planctomycetota bacterium]